ncbi:MAG: rRNA maturation RNase YbeY [Thermoanaerobaculia bacterium]
MEVNVRSSTGDAPPPARVRSALRKIARTARVRPGEVSVLLCGDRRMQALNRRYRRRNSSTDVLAFPSPGGPANGFLGDLAISVPYAARQARRAGEPLDREVDRLLLHGFLHLLGYDHETDEGEMDRLEGRLRKRLKIEARATAGKAR